MIFLFSWYESFMLSDFVQDISKWKRWQIPRFVVLSFSWEETPRWRNCLRLRLPPWSMHTSCTFHLPLLDLGIGEFLWKSSGIWKLSEVHLISHPIISATCKLSLLSSHPKFPVGADELYVLVLLWLPRSNWCIVKLNVPFPTLV